MSCKLVGQLKISIDNVEEFIIGNKISFGRILLHLNFICLFSLINQIGQFKIDFFPSPYYCNQNSAGFYWSIKLPKKLFEVSLSELYFFYSLSCFSRIKKITVCVSSCAFLHMSKMRKKNICARLFSLYFWLFFFFK